MNIDRSNYEIWFTGWLDNSLTSEERQELENFLAINPDLKKELYESGGFIVTPHAVSFEGKNRLKRSGAELHDSQFELMCVAEMEGDLSPVQMEELAGLITANPVRQQIRQLTGKTRLSPPHVDYRNKRSLKRVTTAQLFIRSAAMLMSAAVIAAAVMLSGVFRKPADTKMQPFAESTIPAVETAPVGPVVPVPVPPARSVIVIRETSGTIDPVLAESVASEIMPAIAREEVPSPAELNHTLFISGLSEDASLSVWNFSMPEEILFPSDEPDGNRLGKAVALFVREKVLGHDSPSDAPLKGYELAEAGVEGINRLFGWEMALTFNSDDNGDARSVNFNSRLIKIHTPVNKNSQTE